MPESPPKPPDGEDAANPQVTRKLNKLEAPVNRSSVQALRGMLRAQDKEHKQTRADMLDSFNHCTTHLKRKHQKEVDDLKAENELLANALRELRESGLDFSNTTQDNGHNGLTQLASSSGDIMTRSRVKRARTSANDTAASTPSLSTAPSTGSGIFIPGVPAPVALGDFPTRSSRDGSDGSGGIPSPIVRSSKSFPKCITCYRNQLRCDAGEPCRPCAKKNKKCKRSRCKSFKTGKCRNAQCTRLHEDQVADYGNVVNAGHVSRLDKEK